MVKKWQSIHPLLNVCVEFGDEEKTSAGFKIIDKENDLKNMLFLSLAGEKNELKEEDDEFVWKMLVERESNIKFDITKDYMWRLTFFKFNNTKLESGNLFKYAINLTVQHVISDLKNQFDQVFGMLSF